MRPESPYQPYNWPYVTYSWSISPDLFILHLALLDPVTKRALIIQSAYIHGTVGRVWGTMRQPWYRFWRYWIRGIGKDQIRREYEAHFRSICKFHGAEMLWGEVPRRVWLSSYRNWTGWTEVRDEVMEGRDMVRLEVRV